MERKLLTSVLMAGFILGLAVGCKKTVVNNIDNQRAAILGQVMAERTSALCGNTGRIVLLVNKNNQGVQDRTFGVFCKSLDKSVKIVATEEIDLPASAVPGFEPLSADKFLEVLQKYSATADYLVSFVGMPTLDSAQIRQLPSPRPQVIVVVTHGVPSPAMFHQKVIGLAAIPKMISEEAVASINSGRKSPQELFEMFYQSITRENVLLVH